jgi:hypothetical protein
MYESPHSRRSAYTRSDKEVVSIRTDQWQYKAKCATAPERDRATFTGPYPTKADAQDIARRYCHKCPVMLQCRKWAESERYFSGIAGGVAYSVSNMGGPRRSMYKIPKFGEAS